MRLRETKVIDNCLEVTWEVEVQGDGPEAEKAALAALARMKAASYSSPKEVAA